MQVNVGTPDRLVRVILGLALAAAALFSRLPLFTEPLWFWGALAVAAILIVTAALRFCPLYTPFGISTCKLQQ